MKWLGGLHLLTLRDFGLVWGAGFLSMLAGWALQVALPILIYDLSGSATAVSLAAIVSLLPRLIVAPIAGVFVDRWNRQRTMWVSNLVRASIVLVLVAVEDRSTIVLLYVVLFANSIVAQFLIPAENALLPTLVPDERDLPAANSLNSLNNNLAMLLGPAVGGTLLTIAGFDGIVISYSVACLIAMLLILSLRSDGKAVSIESSEPTQNAPGKWRKIWIDWRAGVHVILEEPRLLRIFVVALILGVGAAASASLTPVFFVDALEGGSSSYGLYLSVRGFGGVFGAILFSIFADRIPLYRQLVWGLILTGVLDLLLFGFPLFVTAVTPAIVLGAFTGPPLAALNASSQTIIQLATPDQFRGRVFSSIDTSMALVGLGATALAGVAADAFGVVPVLLVLSAPLVVAGLYLSIQPVEED
jgi:MFS family permease